MVVLLCGVCVVSADVLHNIVMFRKVVLSCIYYIGI